MPEVARTGSAAQPGCESCGLWRMCFPGLVASVAQRRPDRLRIRRLRVSAGKPLYRSGDRVESFFMVRSGCIRETDDSQGRHCAVVNFALPGEMLSLQCLGNAYSTTTGVAVGTSHVCVVPRDALGEVGREFPQVAAEFIRLVAGAALAARELLTLIRDKEALERVSGFLLNVSARLQTRTMQNTEFRLAMNRDDIANYLGLRSETVSRCFTELARLSLIKVRAKRVQVLNPVGMRRVYYGEARGTSR